MLSAPASFALRIVVPRRLAWVASIPTFEFVPGTPKAWELAPFVSNGFAPEQTVEFGLMRVSDELLGAFDLLADALRYDGRALTLPEGYRGEIHLVAMLRPAYLPGERAVDAQGRDWRLIGRQLDGDGAPGSVWVDSGGPFGHEPLRVEGVPWQAWHVEADDGAIYSLVGEDALEWFVHDPATLQPSPAPAA